MRRLLATILLAATTLPSAVILDGAGPLGGAVALAQSINGPSGGLSGAADGPTLSVSFEDTVTVPGQPLSLRLTVLVPTFMPRPPVWPSLETPNVLVRLPERSTSPTSERVNGETWSGVTRRYSITPMIAGDFALPPQDVVVTFADPKTNAPVAATLTTGPIRFSGVVPEQAKALDPFLAATRLTLEQSIDGEPGAMTPGDSVTRTVTARIEGAPSMFIPDLLPPAEVTGVAAYPAEPVTTDTGNRGTVTGVRTERVTYVAENGGKGEAPAVSISWYNLGSDTIETTSVDPFAIAVDGPPAQQVERMDWRRGAIIAALAIAALGLAVLAVRRATPAVRRRLSAWHAQRLASEGYAWGRLKSAVARRDTATLYGALELWVDRIGGRDPRRRSNVEAALVGIGAARYGSAAAGEDGSWRALSRALAAARHDALHRPESSALPPLNPTHAPP